MATKMKKVWLAEAPEGKHSKRVKKAIAYLINESSLRDNWYGTRRVPLRSIVSHVAPKIKNTEKWEEIANEIKEALMYYTRLGVVSVTSGGYDGPSFYWDGPETQQRRDKRKDLSEKQEVENEKEAIELAEILGLKDGEYYVTSNRTRHDYVVDGISFEASMPTGIEIKVDKLRLAAKRFKKK